MNPWLGSAFVLLVLMVPCLIACLRGDFVNRLVALEAASAMAAIILLLLTEGYSRVPFVDLSLTMALLAFGGGLVFARFFERWL